MKTLTQPLLINQLFPLALACGWLLCPLTGHTQSSDSVATLSLKPAELLSAMPAPPLGSKLIISIAEMDRGVADTPETKGIRAFTWTPPLSKDNGDAAPPEPPKPMTVSLLVLDKGSERNFIASLRQQFTAPEAASAGAIPMKLRGGFTGVLKPIRGDGQRLQGVGSKRLLLEIDMQPCSPQNAKLLLDQLDFTRLGQLEATANSPRWNAKEGFPLIIVDELNPQKNRKTVLNANTSADEEVAPEPNDTPPGS